MNDYVAGSTSVIEVVDLLDSTSTVGAGKTGLTYSDVTCYYKRSNGTASVQVTLATISTLGTFVSGGFKEIDDTNQPGSYEFHPPNAALASGAKWVTFYFLASGTVRRAIKVRILAVDPDDGTRMGMGALPNANAGANGGLPVLSSSATALAYTIALTAAYDLAKTAAQAGDAMTLTSGERGSIRDAILDRVLAGNHDTNGTTGQLLQEAAAEASDAATKATTLVARLGAFTGSGINTVLGFFRALGAKAAALTPTDLSSGTTFDNTTDSLEAQADAGGITEQNITDIVDGVVTELGASPISVINPADNAGTITLIQGDAYNSTTGIVIPFSGTNIPDQPLTFSGSRGASTMTGTATRVSASLINVAIEGTESAKLTGTGWRYSIQAVYSATNHTTIAYGALLSLDEFGRPEYRL